MDQVRKNLALYQNVSTSYVFVAATDWSGASVHSVIAARTGFTLYVIKIALSVTTDNAATQQWQSITTDVPVAKSKASPGLGMLEWDFGPDGYALPAGEGLEHLMSAAGMAGTVEITAYMRRTPGAVMAGTTAGLVD